MTQPPLGWLGIMRLGLVQMSLGAIVVLTTSTLNRVMVVELGLPAILPGLLVALYCAMQSLRPRMGHGSDVGGRRTPWIIGGIALLGVGGVAAALATAWMATNQTAGIIAAVIAFSMIGVGVSAAGTTLLVLLAKRTVPHQRAAAATIVWTMMIAGLAVTAGVVGSLLDPFSFERLVVISIVVSVTALLLTVFAVHGVEGEPQVVNIATANPPETSFRSALADVWADRQARLFTIFVFVSMLAYNAQDLILEPFAGSVFGRTPGQSTKLSGVHHGGVFVGMIAFAICGSLIGGSRLGSLRLWTIGGCLASAVALVGLVLAGIKGPPWPLEGCVFVLGIGNGAFAMAAIASMMSLAGQGQKSREGVRMGLWGAAQGIAFGVGSFLGAAASDIAKYILGSPGSAYASVFAIEAGLFVVAALLAVRVGEVARTQDPNSKSSVRLVGDGLLATSGKG